MKILAVGKKKLKSLRDTTSFRTPGENITDVENTKTIFRCRF